MGGYHLLDLESGEKEFILKPIQKPPPGISDQWSWQMSEKRRKEIMKKLLVFHYDDDDNDGEKGIDRKTHTHTDRKNVYFL